MYNDFGLIPFLTNTFQFTQFVLFEMVNKIQTT